MGRFRRSIEAMALDSVREKERNRVTVAVMISFWKIKGLSERMNPSESGLTALRENQNLNIITLIVPNLRLIISEILTLRVKNGDQFIRQLQTVMADIQKNIYIPLQNVVPVDNHGSGVVWLTYLE